MQKERQPLAEIKGLKKYYPVRDGIIPHTVGLIHAVNGVDFELYQGETLGLVGESGCGKSTIGRQLAALEIPTEGSIVYEGYPFTDRTAAGMRRIRTQIQMVFQDPYTSLNPKKRIFDTLSYPMLYHGVSTRQNIHREVDRLLDMVGLPKNSKGRYPHEFSGGQRQRIGIARALSLNPRLVVCDEPVSALDVSIQAQILNLLRDLQRELKLTYLFIGHGLDAVKYISDRIAVMYLGKIVELADAKELFENPVHPYTQALCSAAPIPDPDARGRKRVILQGELPSNKNMPSGCYFHSRCPYAIEECKRAESALIPIQPGSGHLAACPVLTLGNGQRRQQMLKYIIKRILIAIPVLIGITIIDFLIMTMVGSPLELLQGPRVSQAAIETKRIALGLQQPVYVQYWIWLTNLLQGNMGYSIKSFQPVSQMIKTYIGPTLLLMSVSLFVSMLIAVPAGIYSAVHKYTPQDYTVVTLSFLGSSVPGFFLALVLIYLFTVRLGWLPSSGMYTLGAEKSALDVIRHMIMPVIVLATSMAGTNIRYIRSAMLEILRKDYLRTARAKGIGRFLVINKHALRNALIPVITIFGMHIPILFGGAIIIEQVFSWPGLGMMTMSAIISRDYPVIMGVCLMSAIVVLVANLLTDVIYALVDPTITY